jgi:hypothetical protein
MQVASALTESRSCTRVPIWSSIPEYAYVSHPKETFLLIIPEHGEVHVLHISY